MQTLFTVETPGVRLTWSSPRPTASGAEPLDLVPLSAEAVHLADGVRAETVWLEEETTSLVLLQSLDGRPVSLDHRDPVVTAGLVSADGGRVLHGQVRTGSQAGRMRFVIRSGSRPVFEIGLDVLPTKLSAEEVAVMRTEVEALAAGLAVAALRPTTVLVSHEAADPSPSVWLATLHQSADALADALREVDRRPVMETVREATIQRSGQIRQPSGATRRAVLRIGMEAATLPARPARLTADTPAHRWLAARIDTAVARLSVLAREEGSRSSSARREVVRRELDHLQDRLLSVRSLPVLAGVSGRAPDVPPLVLRRATSYAQAFEALRRLDCGMDLRVGALDVSTQDLAVLYETWSAFAVVRAVAEALGVAPPVRPFGIDVVGADVRLRRGRAHAVHLEGRGVQVEIVNTPRFPAPPALLAQRPDLLLTVRRDGVVRRVVLDAKYRRDDSAAYRRRYGAPGPPEDALGTLHRYRDAIVQGPPIERAAALFPGTPDDAFYTSRLWTSLARLGVGALPLRPGAEDALAAFIGELVR